MAFDPNVIGQIGANTADIAGAVGKGFQLKDLINQETLSSMDVAKARKSEEQSNFLQGLSREFDITKPDQASKAASKAAKAGYPDIATGVLKQSQSLQLGQAQVDEQRFQVGLQAQTRIDEGVQGVLASVNAQTSGPDGKPLLTPQGTEKYDSKTKDAMTVAGVLKMKKDLEDDSTMSPQARQLALAEVNKYLASGQPITFDGINTVARATKTGREAFDKEIQRRKELSTIETQQGNLAERKRHDLAMEGKGTGTGAKAPAGFEWDPDKPDTLRPISGGPKDPNSKPWSGREKVFSERIVTSANEAVRAIKNITELPIGASTGVLGVGESPGHSLFQSGRDVLRNKLSDQETQDYNTMLAGVRRNLATIESVGLAPSGALTEGFASLELRSGDSQLTKLRKLAEMRQIVDAGLEVQLADPAIPDSIKNVMHKVLDNVRGAVPYTQSDVTALQRAQQKNPDATLADLIKGEGLGKSGEANEPTATDAKGNKVVYRNGAWVPLGQ